MKKRYKMIISYTIFVIVGFLGRLFCPYDTRITGYANDPFGEGFIYSYSHDYDSMEKLLYISIPIAVVAIVISIVFVYIDDFLAE